MKRLILIILISFNCLVLSSQKVSNVKAQFVIDKVAVSYDLELEKNQYCFVKLQYSVDASNYFDIKEKYLNCDFGKTKSAGHKVILWNPYAEDSSFKSEHVYFKVIADKAPYGMVFVKGGEFLMGVSDKDRSAPKDQRPLHNVVLSDFCIDKYEVTYKEYYDYCKKSGHKMPVYLKGYKPKDDEPVANVSWNDANDFAEYYHKRLPTEAEWEYAARGGKKTKNYLYSGSNDPYAVGWFYENILKNEKGTLRCQQVGNSILKCNELGIYDMSGNVWEWCRDNYSETIYTFYKENPPKDPRGPSDGAFKVVRGGSCFDKTLNIYYRNKNLPLSPSLKIGFRCVMSTGSK